MSPQEAELDLVWAAGLFDGEGCITLHWRTSNACWVVQTSLAMTHEESVRRFASIIGVGNVNRVREATATARAIWSWSTASKQVEIALNRLVPYLFTKAPQAQLALEARSLQFHRGGRGVPPSTLERMAEIAQRISQLNGLQNKRKVH